MTDQPSSDLVWPALPLAAWEDSYATLHMWTQIVGKIALALSPRTNHFWNVALRVTPRGLATPPLVAQDRLLTLTFDFLQHQLQLQCSDGQGLALPLRPCTVADFYAELMQALARLGITVKIWPMPVEVPHPIRFDLDTQHHAYDPQCVQAFWRALLNMQPVFEQFRAGYLGKCSPVHFFWGSFDLALTRFSGRRAPERSGADPITREAYSHEVISHGFWPGGGVVSDAAFYAYAAPEPAGLSQTAVQPAAAYYHPELKEFILPYAAVRTAVDPRAELMGFLKSTYEAAARLANWNRAELER